MAISGGDHQNKLAVVVVVVVVVSSSSSSYHIKVFNQIEQTLLTEQKRWIGREEEGKEKEGDRFNNKTQTVVDYCVELLLLLLLLSPPLLVFWVSEKKKRGGSEKCDFAMIIITSEW